MNGEAQDLFGAGRHVLETQNIPKLGKLINKSTVETRPFVARPVISIKLSKMECSIKKLRDRLVHNANDNVLRIILERDEQINKDIDKFIGLFVA